MEPTRDSRSPDKLRIAYCGPIAPAGKPAGGGYQAANRRLLDDLTAHGIEVRGYAYPVPAGSKVSKIAAYLLGFSRVAFDLICERSHWDILHLTPLYKQFVYAETLICLIAWLLGKRVFFDIRAGAFLYYYEKRGRLYRACVDRLIRRANGLAVEAEEYLSFVAMRREQVLYLPNYVSSAPQHSPDQRGDEQIRLVFLGRVVPEKGVDTAIATLSSLIAQGIEARLEVIGTGDPDYLAQLEVASHGLPVSWLGAISASQVRQHMRGAHFFVFPTRHLSEGHSNALTEAMAEGLVPICSLNGFNRSVVGDTGRVLPISASGDDYAREIMAIGVGKEWSRLSERARQRVAQRFTGEVVLPALIESYRAAS